MNNIAIPSKPHYDKILSCFKPEWHDKLRVYTGEELYYVYRIMTYKPRYGDMRSSDVFFLVIQNKIRNYCEGKSRYCVNPLAFGKLGRRFKDDFMEFVTQHVDIALASKQLAEHFKSVA
jgi:hypothetical protein